MEPINFARNVGGRGPIDDRRYYKQGIIFAGKLIQQNHDWTRLGLEYEMACCNIWYHSVSKSLY